MNNSDFDEFFDSAGDGEIGKNAAHMRLSEIADYAKKHGYTEDEKRTLFRNLLKRIFTDNDNLRDIDNGK